MNVLVWNENRHEKENKVVSDIYPEGIHGAIAGFLGEDHENVKQPRWMRKNTA